MLLHVMASPQPFEQDSIRPKDPTLLEAFGRSILGTEVNSDGGRLCNRRRRLLQMARRKTVCE